jgi:hypothetical protein
LRDKIYINETYQKIIAEIDDLAKRMQITRSKGKLKRPCAIQVVADNHRLSYWDVRDIYYPIKSRAAKKKVFAKTEK